MADKQHKGRSMLVVYVSHPIRSDPLANEQKIHAICSMLYAQGIVPVAPYLLAMRALPHGSSFGDQRSIVRTTCEEYLARGFVDEMWLYGNEESKGMLDDIELAFRYRLTNVVPQTPTTERVLQHFVNRQAAGLASVR
ncbi:MAG: hypothetical protein ABA06_03895 [Parcubacteria bacterium C7867-001]|nr:MAG: hypothetical protein ABA06_03895 [Parcubacteria bacterium C7867-001]